MSWETMSRSKKNDGLGFRQLYDFNITLLGRKGWRLITEQNSLASKVFKARYYPNNSFLTVKLGTNPIYIWRSMKGVVRFVGNGQDVHIINEI